MVPSEDECEWLHCWLQLVKCQLAMVPNEDECGWLHLWHQHGHCTIIFDSHCYVWINIIFWWAVKSENLLIHYKKRLLLRLGNYLIYTSAAWVWFKFQCTCYEVSSLVLCVHIVHLKFCDHECHLFMWMNEVWMSFTQ